MRPFACKLLICLRIFDGQGVWEVERKAFRRARFGACYVALLHARPVTSACADRLSRQPGESFSSWVRARRRRLRRTRVPARWTTTRRVRSRPVALRSFRWRSAGGLDRPPLLQSL